MLSDEVLVLKQQCQDKAKISIHPSALNFYARVLGAQIQQFQIHENVNARFHVHECAGFFFFLNQPFIVVTATA